MAKKSDCLRTRDNERTGVQQRYRNIRARNLTEKKAKSVTPLEELYVCAQRHYCHSPILQPLASSTPILVAPWSFV